MLKFGKKGIITFLVAALAMVFASGAMAEPVTTSADLKAKLEAGVNVELDGNIDDAGKITILSGKSPILDLSGKSIEMKGGDSARSYLFIIDGGKLTINDTAGNGTIKNTGKLARVVQIGTSSIGEKPINGTGGELVVNAGTLEAADLSIAAYANVLSGNSEEIKSILTIEDGATLKEGGVALFGKGAEVNVNGGKIIAKDYAISGNGRTNYSAERLYGTTINIAGGEITGGECAIYHPQGGILNISGGTITGPDGIQLKAGGAAITNVSGGTIKATGDFVKALTDSSNGSVATGSAISLIGNSGYAGNISLNISGAGVEIISEKGYAVRQEITKGEASQVSSVKISAGTIKGAEGALYFGNYDKDTYSVTGGTYSSDPSAYVESPYVVKQVEGKYVVALAGVAVTPTAAELVLGLTPTAKLTASSDIEEAFTWASKNNDVVTVDSSGNITAVGAGTADVTATGATSKSVGTCVVTVRAATPVSVTPSKMELNIGATGKATAKYDAKDSITWKSSDTAVATVKDGTVTAVKAGIAVITAKGSKTSAACTVTVTDPASPDPVTPTPAPVDAGTVDKENNPVNKEEGKPENVEAATPAITEATEEGKAAVVSATKIEEKNLVATADGKLTISPVLAKSALEEVISADATVAPKNVVLLPIVKAAVTANNVAALAFTMTGEQLGAEENTVAGDVKVIKVLADGKGGQFSYASAAAGYADKTFTLKDADGKSLALTDKVAKASTYTLVIFVADNGDFDLDATAGSVIDPVAVATNAATEPKSGGSSSGCNGGFGALALFGFALVPMFYGKKR